MTQKILVKWKHSKLRVVGGDINPKQDAKIKKEKTRNERRREENEGKQKKGKNFKKDC